MPSATEQTATRLNQVQLHLIELFSRPMTEQELLDIKELLVQYYAQKVDLELDEFWKKRGLHPNLFAKAQKTCISGRKKALILEDCSRHQLLDSNSSPFVRTPVDV